jgi:hypothetical protein
LGGGLYGLAGVGYAEVGWDFALGEMQNASVTLGLEYAYFGEGAAEDVVGLGAGPID